MGETNLITAALFDGAALLGTPSSHNTANNLETILKTRLSAYYTRLSDQVALGHLNDSSSSINLQLLTAREAFNVVEKIQKVLDSEPHGSSSKMDDGLPDQAPSIGTRDLATLRTLLSLVFKWGIDTLFARVRRNWPTEKEVKGSNAIDLTLETGNCQMLATLLMSLFSLLFPDGPQGRISQTLITTTILSRHVTDILLPALALGWAPGSLSTHSLPVLHDARPLVMRLMKLLTPAQTMSSLGTILSSSTTPHVRKACASLLTQELLRPNGVGGLCEAIFSGEEANGDGARIEKLEQIAHTLNSTPATMKQEVPILPRVFKLLITESRTSYRRAAAFTIFRAIVPLKKRPHPTYAHQAILASLHKPFLDFSDAQNQTSENSFLEARSALSSLITLLSNTEPSPPFVSKLLSPIISSLYLLSFDLDKFKTADPQLKESIRALLLSWGKIVDENEGTQILWSIVDGGKGGDWKFNLEGQFWKEGNSGRLQEDSEPTLLLPGNDPETTADVDINLFNLYPDPVHFVDFLKRLERGDMASNIFLKLLENYRAMKERPGEGPMKVLHKLQIATQMQKRLSEGTSPNILRKPENLLSFIFHVFESASLVLEGGSVTGTKQEASRTEDILDDADSDDDTAGSEAIGPDDELIETAITLLLSILEDETLTAHSYPIFNEIFSRLEPLALRGSSTLRPLAREARLVITARLANTSQDRTSKKVKESEEDSQERYQKALKLLQDPILPVRAHGLLLLRQLISPAFSKGRQVNTALVPSILSIFLQSVQDEDSYIFLNAVQGLASLVDTFGKDILQGLVRDYAGGLEGLGGGNLTQTGLDVRTRIGEAMSSVIKRCGSALGIYVDLLVPPLFAVVRGSNIPTPLRTSSLSLLADCVNTYPLAMLPYVEDISQSLVDLLQTETAPLQHRKVQSASSEVPDTDRVRDNKQSEDTNLNLESNTLLTNPRSLSRAALHFLSILISASTKLVYEESTINPIFFPRDMFRRLSITVGYISSTDEDDVVRVMARETRENLEQLQRAVFGL
ncbi:hypothetical protein M413DRAFT_426519 [Hebeloma cylindrosporum]|uniref:Uncharacterized protein n=1 Tax=Hebeloma cylindrosporum TaxID=76867 RepID=A0A0C2Y8R8_HEBCY|nr:hypothetical protein M413DRAFT_426519 [Hebeloma cylindrosporum h7]